MPTTGNMKSAFIINSQFMSKLKLFINKSFHIIIKGFKPFGKLLEIFIKFRESPYFSKYFLHYNFSLNTAKSDKIQIHIQSLPHPRSFAREYRYESTH